MRGFAVGIRSPRFSVDVGFDDVSDPLLESVDFVQEQVGFPASERAVRVAFDPLQKPLKAPAIRATELRARINSPRSWLGRA